MNESGWTVDHSHPHKWETAMEKINDYIKSLNHGYKKALNSENVRYYNKYAKLVSKHEILLTDAKGENEVVTAKNILIATGGRPTAPGIPGEEHAISSDDIFWKSKNPGKTLVVGASYIALECGGFLHGLGCNVTIMVRSIFLRGFDQQLANKIGDYMEKTGVKLIKQSVPLSIKLNSQGRKVVTYKQG
jgi:pyruvate/2-oxoglutarate dehydrogenase complex dihydrolipoamide dehydrogenase (E3) component